MTTVGEHRVSTRAAMVSAVACAALLFMVPASARGQSPGVLHITITLVDAEQRTIPVPRHALLISDNPSTAAPRRVITGVDGSVDVRLRPGNYTVESDQPLAFGGRAYQWTETLDVAAGGEAVLALTADNAEIGPLSSSTSAGEPARETDPALLLQQWKGSVVALWTAGARASGFLFDERGLVATSQKIVGQAKAVEVQITPSVKVGGRVLASDAARDVAVVWVDSAAFSGVQPVPLGCAQSAKPIVEGQEVFALGVPFGMQQDGLSEGDVSRVTPSIAADLRLASGSVGGPVFSSDGDVIGITSAAVDQNGRRREFRVVPMAAVCTVVAAAASAMQALPERPSSARLPVEPQEPFPVAALKEAVSRRAGSLNPYQASSSDFDIAFITPVMTYAAQQPVADRRTTSKDTRTPQMEQMRLSRLMDFGNWSEYVAEVPPVLLVRVTPKLAEGFWTTVARGAAMTQGISLPAMKHVKARFSRMRAFCGEAEITPIHPFVIETPVPGSEPFLEGLYAFEPSAFGRACGSVKLVLYSEKSADGDTRVVDAAVIDRIEQDFAPYSRR